MWNAAGPASRSADQKGSSTLQHVSSVSCHIVSSLPLFSLPYGLTQSRVSTAPGNTGNLLEFYIPPGNTGYLLKSSWPSWKIFITAT